MISAFRSLKPRQAPIYNHWRPYTAIRLTAHDVNAETIPEEVWTNTHRHTYAFPSYPSAHGTACAAALTLIADTFGEDYAFTMRTPGMRQNRGSTPDWTTLKSQSGRPITIRYRQPGRDVPKASDIVSSSTQLVSLPDIYFIVSSLLEDPSASLGDVADVLSTDPALTARCLKLVNSAMYGLSVRVETISRAVSLLGAAQIHNLVLASSVAGVFSGVKMGRVFDLSRFWQTSQRRAVTAQCLATRCHVLDPERLFVAGLLSDIGHLVLHAQEPELTARALQHAEETGQSLAQVERAVVGCDYAEVGGALMSAWRLPETLVETTRYQLEPARAVDCPLEVAIVHIAVLLAEVGEPRPENWADAVHPLAWAMTALDTGIAEEIEAEIIERLAESAELVAPTRRRAI